MSQEHLTILTEEELLSKLKEKEERENKGTCFVHTVDPSKKQEIIEQDFEKYKDVLIID